MVDRNLIRDFSIDDKELELMLGESLTELGETTEELDEIYNQTAQNFEINEVLTGTVIRVEDGEVLVDIGYKSEGIVPAGEWSDEGDLPKPGVEVEVLLEDVEDEYGLILLSKKKADRIRDWERVIAEHNEGDIIKGQVKRKIKGGLLVNIGAKEGEHSGVNVFLPASQVDIRRPQDIGEYVDNEIECVILKIDEQRRNIVVSRRKLIEDQRAEVQSKLLENLEVGQLREGTVKNIADFGAFVDLGGIDGLLHITDMSWGRIDHPTQMVQIDDKIEVMILNIDYEKRKIALGLKQKQASPWENVETKYAVGARVKGEVVNVMSYGAFVKLEDGIEGLVHISEMSWTKRISHPNELVSIGSEVEVVVLGINTEKQEISLGMKQTQQNPWENISDKYPIGKKVTGTVRNLTNYGAFIELEEGVDGLLHVSDMSWTRKISHASEMLKKGDEIECQIISVDSERKRIALGLKQMQGDPWETDIPNRYQPDTLVTGKVTKITNFGVFVELEEELEGLLHISELADHKVNNPEDMVNIGDELEVRVLRVDIEDRKIGLSRRLDATGDPESEGATETGTAGGSTPKEELKGGIGGDGPLFSMGGEVEAPAEEAPASEAPAEETAEAPAEKQAEASAEAETSAEEPAAEEATSEEAATEEEKTE